MNNNTIGIIGGGFVGSATAWAVRPTHEVKVYDKAPKASTHTFEEAIDSDFVFICVPTPMTPDGHFDVIILNSAITKFSPGKILIIKSRKK